MVPINARLVADLMNACVDVDDNIDAAKKYTSCFQVRAGCPDVACLAVSRAGGLRVSLVVSLACLPTRLPAWLPACQCACGGALRVIKTSAENKQRFHLVDDFFIGCCRYSPNKADSCNTKYTIKDLQSAVNQAPRDFCR